MAVSKVTLYKTKLTPSKNFWLDNIQDYLNKCIKLTFNDFQYQKIEADIVIKINLDQEYQHDLGYNYAVVNQDDYYYYYFITNVKQIAQKTLELSLSIDSIHTYRYLINNHFSDKTKITRQHKDRYITPQSEITDNQVVISRNVDEVSEGGSLPKYKTSINNVPATSPNIINRKWYLIYRSSTTDENSGVNCYLCSNEAIRLPGSGIGNEGIDKTGVQYGLCYLDNISPTYQIEINGVNYNNPNITFFYNTSTGKILYHFWSYDTSTGLYTVQEAHDVAFNNFKIKSDVFMRIKSTSGDLNLNRRDEYQLIDFITQYQYYQCLPIDKIDKTDSRLIKIIELPYLPVEPTINNNIYNFSNTNFRFDTISLLLKLDDLSTQFSSVVNTNLQIPEMRVTVPALSSRRTALKDIKYESKLYHSDFYTYKYVYDSFSKEILLQNFKPVTYLAATGFRIDFYQSSNITSNLMFKFTPYSATYLESSDFDKYLVANRNNEVPIFNNSYLNYIRNGYNYDKKNKERQDVFNWVGTGLQIAGAIASFAVSTIPGAQVSAAAGISLAASATASIASNINSTISAESNIAEKLNELKSQSASVSGSDDLSLLNAYEGQILKYSSWSVSNTVKDTIFDLFYYCGYADGRQAIPNYNSRRCFNYLQCEPVFDNEDDPILIKYLEDIKARFKAGVTVLHKFNNGYEVNYDFEQKYENFETWICPRV